MGSRKPYPFSKVIFLDRDGVINRDQGNDYIGGWKKFHFLSGALKALKLLKEAGYRVVVVSNQGGVSKGLYTLKELSTITRKMKRIVRTSGGRLDAVYYCPHKIEDRCRCRKPKTALFRKAKQKFQFRWTEAFVVGDSVRDIAAGRSLCCKTILVLSGREKLRRRRMWDPQPDVVKKNLLDAVRWILSQ